MYMIRETKRYKALHIYSPLTSSIINQLTNNYQIERLILRELRVSVNNSICRTQLRFDDKTLSRLYENAASLKGVPGKAPNPRHGNRVYLYLTSPAVNTYAYGDTLEYMSMSPKSTHPVI